MPGNLIFRPVEANLTHDTDWLGKMDPYCKFSIGTTHAQSSVCRHGGTRPHWGDTVTLPTTGTTGLTGAPNVVRLEVFDKDKFRPDDHIAYTDIDIAEIEQRGSVSRWYPLYHRKKPAGEILIEAAIQQQPQQFVQNVVPTTTYVQETVLTSTPVNQVVGESYVVNETISQTQGLPLNQGYLGSTNLGSYTTTNVDPNLGLYGNNAGLIGGTTTGLIGGTSTNYVSGTNFGTNLGTDPGFIGTNQTIGGTGPVLASQVSALGPSGGLPHGHKILQGQTNAGYSQRPGYTLGDAEANPTCQSNLDTNGGGFFNKPGRERRAEPYSLSNPGTYGIPHGQTIDTAGHLRPDVTLQRQAPIGTINHPGITGYVDGYNKTQDQLLAQQGGLGQGSYGTGLNSGFAQQGGLGQGSYTSGLSQPGLNQGSYTTGLPQSGLQGSYTTGLGQQGVGLNQGLGQQNLSYGQQGLGQQGLGLNQQGLGQQGLGLNQQGLGQGSFNTGLNQNLGQNKPF